MCRCLTLNFDLTCSVGSVRDEEDNDEQSEPESAPPPSEGTPATSVAGEEDEQAADSCRKPVKKISAPPLDVQVMTILRMVLKLSVAE